MYSSPITLKYLMLKVDREASLYHQVTDYDHIIAYYRLALVVINVKVMVNYLSAREFWHEKGYLNITSFTIHASGCAIIYFMRPHLVFIMIMVSSFYYAVG